MWKRLNFCGSGSTLKKEAGRGSKLGSDQLFSELEAEAKKEAEAKIFYCFQIPDQPIDPTRSCRFLRNFY